MIVMFTIKDPIMDLLFRPASRNRFSVMAKALQIVWNVPILRRMLEKWYIYILLPGKFSNVYSNGYFLITSDWLRISNPVFKLRRLVK